ncbi:Na(+)/H(+) antiporter subunit D [Aliiglaciecola sp. CAU 1673]|uniref:Na(+)/H(+) antiporter subunit D n=1 Tax=Aliiglaciecola sp. CAU 1673 TaxID=3032595 RepID=UPI0023D98BB9|nr:Na(+)/H(+) antiporter subunit D [Aliiglaciecola sp. CAU 1673]MDF2179848.1 Na(+)/H(+) antiporter subunit D [Aliiglaciecola sp. CAU 1673]
MISADIPPFLPFFLASILLPWFTGWWQRLLMLVPPVLGGIMLLLFPPTEVTASLMGFELALIHADKLSLLFGLLFHLAAILAFIFSWHKQSRFEPSLSMLYAGSAIGAVFSGDLISLFIFWELLALSSAGLVMMGGQADSRNAGLRYLYAHILSGLLLLSGILLHYQQSGSLAFDKLSLDTLAGVLIFLAFGIKCAFPLLHGWITDAYANASAAGAVFLSAFTTKVAVYALARSFAGTEILIYIGAIMTCFPIFYAVIENDLRKVLAYSMINQLGFMVCGIGLGTALALNGAVAHAFADVIFKGLLFMSMGAVLFRTGHTLGSDLGGLYKSMPKTTVLCLVGAASISAFPLFSGFVTKSMVMLAMLEQGYPILWLMLLFASAGVFHHAGIKIPYFAFFAHDRGYQVNEAPWTMLLAMGVSAVLCILIGSYPELLYQWLPWSTSYQPYDLTHSLTQMQLLCFSALAFVWLNKRGLYPPELRSINLDIDWFYRRLLPLVAEALVRDMRAVRAKLYEGFTSLVQKMPRKPAFTPWTTSDLTLRLALVLALLLVISLLA